MSPSVRATRGVVSVKFWDFIVVLARGGGGAYNRNKLHCHRQKTEVQQLEEVVDGHLSQHTSADPWKGVGGDGGEGGRSQGAHNASRVVGGWQGGHGKPKLLIAAVRALYINAHDDSSSRRPLSALGFQVRAYGCTPGSQ